MPTSLALKHKVLSELIDELNRIPELEGKVGGSDPSIPMDDDDELGGDKPQSASLEVLDISKDPKEDGDGTPVDAPKVPTDDSEDDATEGKEYDDPTDVKSRFKKLMAGR